ncbi:Zn-dependent alcohol dehydrogenase [Spinactinospora alkalitolerans]|uniref:Zn-dependent alcohol dehydrogenase n=1 Tax=Spinactinospora alkalitolerans TaxID=687207 RepID=A0A852TXY4_9ACTN|nr:hypothetical protein [Spinactinospora alkalitolerans]NYE47822.1 Zn-dependent alcohol dehydrogenase [Spinactinospora alkalitolerans]
MIGPGSGAVLGCNYGSSVPSVDSPRLARMYLSGRLPLDRMIGRSARLEEADDALDDLRNGRGLRTILHM